MSVEFIGYVGHFNSSETMRRTTLALDPGYVETVAKAHEHVGFDRVLVAFNSTSAESILVGQHIAAVTSRLGLMIAHRPGFTAPTLAARQLATLDHLSRGRAAVHIITGSNDTELARDGDYLTKDERYARTSEYLDVLRPEWTAAAPFDYAGRYYQVAGGFGDLKPYREAGIPVYFGGASEAAIPVAGKHADVYALWGETYDQVRSLIARIRAAAAPFGRKPRFSLSLRPVLADTEARAWDKAGAILAQARALKASGQRPLAEQCPPGATGVGQRGVAPPARRRGAGLQAGQAALDGDRGAHRRAGQLHGAGWHAGAGRRRHAGLLRPGYNHVLGPWLRPAGRRNPIRARTDSAGPCPHRRPRDDVRRGRVAKRGSHSDPAINGGKFHGRFCTGYRRACPHGVFSVVFVNTPGVERWRHAIVHGSTWPRLQRKPMATSRHDAKNLGLASLGAVLEYFDFQVYVFVAAAISVAFFPPGASPWIAQVQAFGIYAVGYLVRPIAGIIIAHFADRIGRKKLFVFTVLLMSVPTFLMGLLPSYAMIGWVAPALLLLLRVLQGCAVGGELPGAAVFVSEHAPARRLGVASGVFQGVTNCGLLMGAGAAALASVVAGLDPAFSSMAWRLPFLLGGMFGLLAAYLRRQLQETPLFEKMKSEGRESTKMPLAVDRDAVSQAMHPSHWR